MRLSVLFCSVHWLTIGLFSAFIALLTTPAYAQTEVSSDWPLKPSGLNVGDEFRLMFMGKIRGGGLDGLRWPRKIGQVANVLILQF